MQKTYKITISGQVQGVGFRPYVFTLASKLNLTGSVSNNEVGVVVFVSGLLNDILIFYKKLIENPPNVSLIDQHFLEEIDPVVFSDFRIIPSKKAAKLNLQLTPDFAICPDCRKDISDKNNRRLNYPFTTCVNCGPRWAITRIFPFERAHTSISKFEMCKNCKREYEDPSNRRFHSQTNTCPECGINLRLVDAKGISYPQTNSDLFNKVSELLVDGNIVAIKNTGGYLLCCDATNANAIQKLRNKKRRPTKPFAILYPSLQQLKNELALSAENEKILNSSEAPIIIIQKTNYKGKLALDELAPGLNQLGVMLPYTGILQLLADKIKIPIVATSGNIHGSPIISSAEVAISELVEVADYFLHHNLDILNPQDDSVVKFSPKYGQKVLFRRSRGYAPNFFGNFSVTEKIIAMGGHLKSTIAFLPNDYLYVSQYIGNLDNFNVYERFVEISSNFIALFEQDPEVVLIDAHPSYQSTIYGKELAKNFDTKTYKVQHHKAHFASVLGEHDLFNKKDPILGVVWDGTGYGDDQQIWGGEFFIYKANKIDRVSHFEYFDWLGGDKMAKEPRLSLFSMADDELLASISDRYTREEIGVFKKMKEGNQLKTSSVGRLFDAVASLLDICQINTYEGEAAVLLENYITHYDISSCGSYCSITKDGKIPSQLLLKKLFLAMKNGSSRETLILNFLYTLASLILEIADHFELKEIACSGGVFQNTVLIDMLNELAQNKYRLYFNRNLSPNDENISFGQIMYYLNLKS